MKKWTAMISGAVVTTFLLAGCSTANNENGQNAPKDDVQNKTAQKEATQKEVTQNNTQKATETVGTNEATSEKQDKGISSKEQQLQYSFNGATKTETAVLTKSDNQPFSLYLLPSFELSGEEPGKDVVLLKADDNIFMRIELLPENVNWTDVENNVKAQLSSISKQIYNPGLKIDNGISYEASNNNDVVTAILLKDTKTPVRLTLFTTKNADYRDAFIQMAKTIQKQ